MTPFTLTTFVAGCILSLIGGITIYYPPKKINNIYGYRTKASMRNQQTWEEGNRYCSKQVLYCGLILLTIGILSVLSSSIGKTSIHIATILTIILSILPVLSTEIHLKRVFDKEGNRRIE
ncbi:MAG: SdpI family protein [Chitinophagaceae bacterium]|nr:SdpI family protein [Chitinophagaceae bacterium]